MLNFQVPTTVLRAVLLLSFATTFAQPCWATRAECEKALLAVQTLLGDGPKTEIYDDEGRRQVEPTVMVESSMDGEHGGRRLTLLRTGARWLSSYRTVDYDPQGDPRWFIETMGTEAAAFFGFKILGDERVIVPDGAEFNGALKKLNRHLESIGKDPIEISFYVTPGNENTKVAEYVRDYGLANLLPLAATGNHLIHDLSFHTGAIFFPGHLVRLSSYFARVLDGYAGFLERRFEHDPAKLSAAKHFMFLLRMNHTITIDTATGTVNAGIVASLRKPGSPDALEMLFAPTVLLSGQGHTAHDYFARRIRALEPKAVEHISEFQGFSPADRTITAAENLSIAEMLSALDDFYRPENIDGFKEFGSTAVPTSDQVVESFCRGIHQRRLVIRRAALDLLGKSRDQVLPEAAP